MDGGTGELIGSTDETSVTITVTGEDKDGVVNQLGERSSEFYSFSGLLTLALNPKDLIFRHLKIQLSLLL